MKTVFINSKGGEISSSQQLSINSINKLNSSFVEVVNYVNKDDLGVLLQLSHNQIITRLNLTDVTPFLLLFFDDELCLQGLSYSFKSSSGSFTIQTQHKNILFIKHPNSLIVDGIQYLSFKE